MGRARADSAFTLIEILVGLVLIGLLLLISVPAFDNWLATYRLRSDSRALASELALARFRAISGSQTIAFIIENGSGYAATYRFSPGGPFRHLSESVSIQSVVGDNPILFNSRGMASAETTVHFVNQRGQSTSVSVNFNGMVVMSEGP